MKSDNDIQFPRHVAFIMDGNGRWAQNRLLPRSLGHRQGVKTLMNILDFAFSSGVRYVSVYAFSTENWNRPKDEIDEIFKIAQKLCSDRLEDYIKNNMKLVVTGSRKGLPKTLVDAISNCEEKTKNNTGILINIALNYGGRAEIINAINNIIKDGLKQVDEKIFRNYLQTANISDPDLLIRTSGEQRLSNYMMYQCAYSELYFPKIHWPDFRERELEKAIIAFQKRDRRFGAIKG